MNERTLRLSAGQSVSDIFRYAVGLEKIIEQLAFTNTGNYPPHNIERLDQDRYVIEMAVAGFSNHELHIVVENGTLNVKGERTSVTSDENYVHRGIALRNFHRQFNLGDNVLVSGASLKDGLLRINLERVVPEDKKPITIKID